jgi:hypothetical protein
MDELDLFLYNGRFHTFSSDRKEIRCVAVKNGRIVETGDDGLVPLIAHSKVSVDLRGMDVYPGFIDAHTHLAQFGLELSRPDLFNTSSHEEVFHLLDRAVNEREKGTLLIAVNWDQSRWKENRCITREQLDRKFPAQPVILRRICGHIAVANSRAMDMAQFPPGTVDRHSGVLLEEAALFIDRIFPTPKETRKEYLKRAISYAHSKGVTGIHEISGLSNYRIFDELTAHRMVKLRVSFYVSVDDIHLIDAEEMRRSRHDYLNLKGVKLFADGSLGAHTAALRSPYYDLPTSRGRLNYRKDMLRKELRRIDGMNMQAVVHAIGDRAVEQVVQCFSSVVKEGNPLRHRIEHLELCSRNMRERIRRMHLFVCVQPNFVGRWGGDTGLYRSVLGPTRRKRSNPFRSMDDMGMEIAFGSDCMPFSPLYGVNAAVHHPVDGQRIHPERAFELYSRKGAKFSFDEDCAGTIEEGKYADFVVLPKPDEYGNGIPEIVFMTIFDGEIVYRNDAALPKKMTSSHG